MSYTIHDYARWFEETVETNVTQGALDIGFQEVKFTLWITSGGCEYATTLQVKCERHELQYEILGWHCSQYKHRTVAGRRIYLIVSTVLAPEVLL
jgi:hypothetical protein